MTKKILLFALAFAASACQRQPDVSEPVATPAGPAGVVRLAPGEVNVLLAPGVGVMNQATGKLEIPVKITNRGRLALSSAMNLPVNLGVQVMPASNGTGGVIDFTRTTLPEIKPGQTILVPVVVPVDARVNGHYLKIELVQEHVAWFASLGQPGVKVGPYTVCDHSLCLAAGQ